MYVRIAVAQGSDAKIVGKGCLGEGLDAGEKKIKGIMRVFYIYLLIYVHAFAREKESERERKTSLYDDNDSLFDLEFNAVIRKYGALK
jgi:hypothetical protein